MKLNKIKAIFPAIALFLTASMTSCMDDLEKGNIDPTVEPNPNLLGLYSKCYAGLIMEGNDGNADFTIDDAGKSTLLRNVFNFNELSTDEAICWWSDGGITLSLIHISVPPANLSIWNWFPTAPGLLPTVM